MGILTVLSISMTFSLVPGGLFMSPANQHSTDDLYTMIQALNATLTQQNKLLSQQNTTLAQQSTALAQQNVTLGQQSATLALQSATIQSLLQKNSMYINLHYIDLLSFCLRFSRKNAGH